MSHYEMYLLWNVVTMNFSYYEMSHYELRLWNDDYEKCHYEIIHCRLKFNDV